MLRFSESDVARRWLDRSLNADREIAASLIDEVLPVSAGELANSMTRLFDKIQAEHGSQRPLAFYAEREVEWDENQVLPIFPGARDGRAVGKGPPPGVTCIAYFTSSRDKLFSSGAVTRGRPFLEGIREYA